MSKEIDVSSRLVNQYFGLELPSVDVTYQLLLEKLTRQIKFMLDEDFQGLLNAMYRIDVEESKFSIALETGNPDDVAENVAILILDRIVRKAKTRLKYSGE